MSLEKRMSHFVNCLERWSPDRVETHDQGVVVVGKLRDCNSDPSRAVVVFTELHVKRNRKAQKTREVGGSAIILLVSDVVTEEEMQTPFEAHPTLLPFLYESESGVVPAWFGFGHLVRGRTAEMNVEEGFEYEVENLLLTEGKTEGKAHVFKHCYVKVQYQAPA